MFRTTSFALVALLTTAAAPAQQPLPAPSTGGRDIVVTGTPLKDLRTALARCLDQHCPPDKDIDATLAVAEAQFVAGQYRDARATMLKSIDRNRRFAKTYPEPVSDLYRAHSRVAAHLGEDGAYFGSALDVVSTLKAGFPDDDWRVLGAKIELGDAYFKTGRFEDAVGLYRSVARRAHELHLGRAEGMALLSIANAYVAASRVRNDGYYAAALKACDAVRAATDPAIAPFGAAATVLKAKLAVKAGDPGAVGQLVATYRTLANGATKPVLLYAPTIDRPLLAYLEFPDGEAMKGGDHNFADQWVDIGFSIASDGTVDEAEVLRQSPQYSGKWAQPVVAAIRGRRYAPNATGPGTSRVERYTYTAKWEFETGSRIRARRPVPKIEVLDLTRDPAPVAS
ncbi:hypothetical protein [Sphingomonas sp. UYP23]